MKNLLKNFKFILALGLCSILPITLMAAKNSKDKGKAKTEELKEAVPDENLDDLDMVEMIYSVPLDSKSAELIRAIQSRVGRQYLRNKFFPDSTKYNVETYNNREVIIVTIPSSELFNPNETQLKSSAASLLKPFVPLLKDPDMYRIMLVMHTDNTGSQRYRDELTADRSTAVYEWFARQGLDTEYLFPYALADDSPIVENNSMDNREKNRRLEVYLIPGRKMLGYAQKGEATLKKYINSIIPF